MIRYQLMGKLLLGMAVGLILIGGGIAAVLGMIPGLSNLIGAGPHDLGIRYTQADSQAAQLKEGTEIKILPAGETAKKDFTLEGRKETAFTMDSQELTSLANNRKWINYPVKKIQIKIGEDGTIQSSGILIVSKAMSYATALGFGEKEIKQALDKYHIPPIETSFYIKGKGQVINNQVVVDATELKIGAIAVPGEIVKMANTEAMGVLEQIISRYQPSFEAREVSFNHGIMKFAGAVPEKEWIKGN